MSIFGLVFSDKTFTYILAGQLAWAQGWRSLLPALSGVFSGLLLRSRSLPLRHLKLPSFLDGILSFLFDTVYEYNNNIPPQLARNRPPIVAAANRGNRVDRNITNGENNPSPSALRNRTAPPSDEAIDQLQALGFDREVARSMLVKTGNNVQVAANRLLSEGVS
eukprot:g5573.t1